MAVDITTIGIEMDTTSVKAGTADLTKAAIAGQQMADSLDKSADKVVKAGAKQEQAYKEVSREAAATARKQEQEAERAASKVQEAAAQAARSAQNQSRSVMQNLGWQTQDAIVQLQMGTAAATVFSQQGSQLASAWNPMLGLFVAVAGVVGGALLSSFSNASDISEELAEKIRELNKEYTTLGESQRKFLVDEEIKKQKELREEAEKYRKEVKDLNDELSRRITRGTSGQMNGQSLDTDEVRNRIMQQNLELTQQITAAEGALETQNQLLAKSKDEVKRINGEQVEGDKVKLTTAQELIKSLEDEKAALELSGDAMADYIAKKAEATGADYEKIKSIYLEIEALELKKESEKQAQQESDKALRVEQQRSKSINEAITNLEKQNQLYTSTNGVQSKYADILLQIETGLIKVTDAEKARYLAAATANDQLAANKRLADSISDFSKKSEEDKKNLDKLIESVDDFGGAWTRTGSIIADTLGGVVAHLDDYKSRIDDIGKKEAQLAEEKKKFIGDPKELTKIADAEKKLAVERTKANISSYRSIAGASAEMFSEQSKGRKALHAIEKTLAAVELAMAIQNTVKELALSATRTTAATAEAGVSVAAGGAKMFAQSGWGGFAGVAAMMAVMASLGFSGSGGSGGQSAADIQESQGTGSVLGSNDKSESISSAFEQYLDVGIESLGELRKIREGLTGLSGGIDRLSIGVVTSGLTDTKYVNFANTHLGVPLEAGRFELTGMRDVDAERRAMLEPLQSQMVDIFKSIGSTINEGISALGLTTDQSINAFYMQIGKISFEGLSGEEIQSELNAIFSQQADLITGFLVPAMAEYQQMGEGLFETLTRVASEMATFNYYTDALGLSFSETGLSAIAVQQNIAELSGGMDKLSANMATYYEEFFTEEERAANQMALLSAEMKNLGYDIVPSSREGFRNLVNAIDLTTESGQKQFAGLMSLSEVFADLIPQTEALVEASRSASDIAKERASLMDREWQMTATTEQIRQKEIDALDSTNQEILKRIFALQDFQAEEKLIATERAAALNQLASLEKQYFDLTATEAEKRSVLIGSLLSDEAREIQDNINAWNDAKKAQEEAANSAKLIADQRLSLEQQYFDLTATEQEKRTANLAALLSDESRTIQENIYAWHDAQAAAAEAANEIQNVAKAAEELAQKQAQIANERYSLETQLLQVMGNTDALRARELEKLDESNRALQLQIWAAEEQKSASEMAANAAEKEAQEKERAVEEQRKAQERLADDAAKAQQKALDDARKAAEEQRKLAQGVHDSISDALRSLMGESEAFNQMGMSQARQTLQGALSVAQKGGSLVGYAGLDEALGAIQNLDASRFSSAFEYNQAMGQNIGLLSQLEQYTRVNGSHANGLDYVPFDGYVAQLHKGERVMTSAENKGQGELIAEIRALRSDLKAGDNATNGKMLSLLRIVEKWDGDGLPLERVS